MAKPTSFDSVDRNHHAIRLNRWEIQIATRELLERTYLRRNEMSIRCLFAVGVFLATSLLPIASPCSELKQSPSAVKVMEASDKNAEQELLKLNAEMAKAEVNA